MSALLDQENVASRELGAGGGLSTLPVHQTFLNQAALNAWVVKWAEQAPLAKRNALLTLSTLRCEHAPPAPQYSAGLAAHPPPLPLWCSAARGL